MTMITEMNGLDEMVAIDKAVAKMRQLGIYKLRTAQLEIELGPPPALEEPPTEHNSKLERRGKDGLTLREQIELYGRAIDEGKISEEEND